MWFQQLHAHIKRIPWFWFRFLLLLLSFSQMKRMSILEKIGGSQAAILAVMAFCSRICSHWTWRKSALKHWESSNQPRLTADSKVPGAFPPWPVIKIILVTGVYAAPIFFRRSIFTQPPKQTYKYTCSNRFSHFCNSKRPVILLILSQSKIIQQVLNHQLQCPTIPTPTERSSPLPRARVIKVHLPSLAALTVQKHLIELCNI